MEYKSSKRKEKLEKLKANLGRQQTIFKKQNTETEKNTKASYTVSYLNAKKMKLFTVVEFIEECMMSVVREGLRRKESCFQKYYSLSKNSDTTN